MTHIRGSKPIETVNQEARQRAFNRILSIKEIIAIGLGGVVGAGIYVLTGKQRSRISTDWRF